MSANATEISVHIRSLAVGGAGVGEVTAQNDGRSDLLGITAFVPFTAVGERVSARIVQRKDRYLQAQLLNVEQPSLARVTPPCKIFTQCGGCELQHIDYASQLRLKHEMILGALRAGKLASADLEKLAPVVPGDPYGYRRRISLHVDQAGKIGFYRESSRSVVATDECPVAVEDINELLKVIPDFGREIRGKISSLLLESDDAGVVAVLKSPYAMSPAEARGILDTAKKYFPNAMLLAADKELGGYGRQILELPLNDRGTVTLRVPAGYFSQVNSRINSLLVSRAVDLLDLRFGETVFDLYAGAGNFSLPLARAGAKVTAVECDPRLVSLGKENAARYGLQKNLEFIELSVEKFLDRQQKNRETPGVLLADPPRSGLGPICASLPPSERLMLVSCHLPSFVRDSKNLTERGWELQQIIPFDMFAQTSYVEILSLFRRT